MSKQYGLIIPNKNRGHQVQELVAKPSIFNDDSDSETDSAKPTGITKTVKKQHIINHEKAVEEDPTVFQYDEIYDEMDKKRKESKLARKDLDKKPKYINRLLATAERRKRENERRIERQVQKEREAEGEQFKDKESFVTSAYKKKLEELKQLEEQEQREEYLESIGDVKKQGNLDGFYRHLYDQKVCYEDKVDEEIKVESENSTAKRKISDDKNPDKKRSYRRRQDSKESDNGSPDEEETVKREHLPSNLDADSDFSIDSSDSEDDDNSPKKDKKESGSKSEETEQNASNTSVSLQPETSTAEVKPDIKEEVNENKENTDENSEKAEDVIKPKIDIWKKRTVGAIFDEALKRYYERKALREAGN